MPITLSDQGLNNILEIPPEAKGNIEISIAGNNNHIRIKNLRRVDHLKITIQGDNGCFEMDPFRIGKLSVFIKNGSLVTIGKATSIESAQILADHATQVQIGEDCMISYNVQIRTTDAHGIYSLTTGERVNPAGDIMIGDHVWLGQGALISKGSVISRNTVVGACAFVQNKAFPPSCVVAGTPAKLIQSNVIWDRREAEKVELTDESMDPQFEKWWSIARHDAKL